jgi:hypothetical protein
MAMRAIYPIAVLIGGPQSDGAAEACGLREVVDGAGEIGDEDVIVSFGEVKGEISPLGFSQTDFQ